MLHSLNTTLENLNASDFLVYSLTATRGRELYKYLRVLPVFRQKNLEKPTRVAELPRGIGLNGVEVSANLLYSPFNSGPCCQGRHYTD
ncbi:MAG: hypothetical protein ACJAX5_000901 [Patiriisocius sp.]|jgi:hypothetical protein